VVNPTTLLDVALLTLDDDDGGSAAMEKAQAQVDFLASAPVPPPGTTAEAQRAIDMKRAQEALVELAEARRRRQVMQRKRRRASRIARTPPPFPAPSCKGWLRLVDLHNTGFVGFGPGFNGYRGAAEVEAADHSKRLLEAQRRRFSFNQLAINAAAEVGGAEAAAAVAAAAAAAAVTAGASSSSPPPPSSSSSQSAAAAAAGTATPGKEKGGRKNVRLSLLSATGSAEEEAVAAELRRLGSKLGSEVEGRGIGGSEEGLELVSRII
jgi:hypothetical protein